MYEIKVGEPDTVQRRIYFHIVGTDGITPALLETGGQPQISTNGGSWTSVGVGTLIHIGNGRYYADLTIAALGSEGTRIETRYKSANTAEIPGDSVTIVATDFNGMSANSGIVVAATSTTITIGSTASLVDNIYQGNVVVITGGTGKGQARAVLSYVGSTKVLTIPRPWFVIPDTTSTYVVLSDVKPKITDNLEVYSTLVTGAIDVNTLSSNLDTYQAKVWVFDDNLASVDRYTVVWFKNGQPITTGISSPNIQVIKSSDGTNLIASVALAEITAGTGLYKREETTNRIVSGASYIVKVTATIDSGIRTWFQPTGRDS